MIDPTPVTKNPELKKERLQKEITDLQNQREIIQKNNPGFREKKELVYWLIGLFAVGALLITVAVLTKFETANSFWSFPLGIGFIVFGIVLVNAQRKNEKKAKFDKEEKIKLIDLEIDRKKKELEE